MRTTRRFYSLGGINVATYDLRRPCRASIGTCQPAAGSSSASSIRGTISLEEELLELRWIVRYEMRHLFVALP